AATPEASFSIGLSVPSPSWATCAVREVATSIATGPGEAEGAWCGSADNTRCAPSAQEEASSEARATPTDIASVRTTRPLLSGAGSNSADRGRPRYGGAGKHADTARCWT